MTDQQQPASGTDRLRRFILPLGPPMAVNVKGLPMEQIHALMDGMEKVLGGSFFRDRELLLEVLQDQVVAAANPRAFLYGPYLALVTTPAGVTRITSFDKLDNDVGFAVYDFDRVMEGLALMNAEGPAENRPSRPRQRS